MRSSNMALNDRELLAKTLQAEAGNQGIGGMLAVGSVIRNRMAQGGSLSDVILAPAQFSAWNKVTGAVGGEQGQDMAALKPSEDAYAAADAILSGNAPDLTGGATHYYNPSISNPAWGKEKAGGDWTKIGAHIFGKAGDFRTGAAKMNGEQTQKPQGLLGGLLGGQGIGGALGMSDDFRDKLKMAILAGTGDARMDPLIEATQARMKERRAEAKELKSTNKTLEYLKTRADAGDSLARAYHDAVATGTLKGGAAVANYLKDSQTGTKDTALIRQALAAGLKQGTPEFQRYILSGGDIYSQETELLASLPKPEKGMRYQFDKDETGAIVNYRLIPITGSAADKEAEKIQQAAEAQRSAQSASGMVVLEDIGKAIDIAKENPVLSTGFVGGVLRNIGGTAAKDLASLTTTIKANIGFDRLQRMREESPTGGALGQVAVQELEALQSTLGNLDNSQSNEQVVANLERLEAQYRKSMREIYNAALADQQKGLVNKRTGQPVSPMDYFSEADIAMLSGQTQAAPAQTQPRTDDDLLKKYGG